MSNFFKKFKNYYFQKKIFIYSIICLFLFSPVFVSASLLSGIVNAISLVPMLGIITLLTTCILISQSIVTLTGGLLDLIISPNFTNFSYTQPCPNPYVGPGITETCNPIIGVGFDITKQLVNLALVVILVFISLSIALKLDEKKQQTALVKLIGVALLVNFAPVFLGLIVDASNIVMNYFLEAIQKSGGLSGLFSQLGLFVTAIGKLIGSSGGIGAGIENRLGLLAMAVTVIFLNLNIALVFLILTALFLFRYIIIWFLVILSPLAFVCFILPQTYSIFKKWFNNFIQWSIIGIPISFFLYLAVANFSVFSANFKANLELTEFERSSTGLFNQIFPFIIVVIFIWLGFIFGLQSTAMGSGVIMKYAGQARGIMNKRFIRGTLKVGKAAWAGTGIGRLSGTLGRRIGTGGMRTLDWMRRQRGIIGGLGRGIEGGREWMRRAPYVKTGFAREKGVGGNIAALLGVDLLQRGIGGANLILRERRKANLAKNEEKYEKTSIERMTADFNNNATSPDKKVAILHAAHKTGRINSFKKSLEDNAYGRNEEERTKNVENDITRTGERALRIGVEEFKPIRDAFPHLAEEMGKNFSEEIRKAAGVDKTALKEGYSSVMEQIIGEMKKENITRMDTSILDKNKKPEEYEICINTMVKKWESPQWAEALFSFGKKFKETIEGRWKEKPTEFTLSAQKYFQNTLAKRLLETGTGKEENEEESEERKRKVWESLKKGA